MAPAAGSNFTFFGNGFLKPQTLPSRVLSVPKVDNHFAPVSAGAFL